MQFPENFERFLVDNVKQMIVQNVKTNHSDKLLTFIGLQPTVACQRTWRQHPTMIMTTIIILMSTFTVLSTWQRVIARVHTVDLMNTDSAPHGCQKLRLSQLTWAMTLPIDCYNNNKNDRFTALCPRLPGWAGTRRNIHPPTILIIIQSLSASSVYHDP